MYKEFKSGDIDFSYEQRQLGVSILHSRQVNGGGHEFSLKVLRPGTKNPVWGYLVLTREEADLLVKHIKSNKYRKVKK